MAGQGNLSEGTMFTAGGLELDREDSRKARMLYDYDAVNQDEITINSGEVWCEFVLCY